MNQLPAICGSNRFSAFVRPSCLILPLLSLLFVAVSPLEAQQTGDPTQTLPASTPGGDPGGPVQHPPAPAPEQKAATSVNVFTGMGMVSSDHYQPLTRRQRWDYYVNQNFTSVGSYFGPVLSSIIDQSNGQPPEWGGGMGGYGKRLASRFGTGVIQGSVQSAGTTILKQDPRYIRSSDQRILRRIGHAFIYTIITYNDSGQNRLAIATLGSYYASSMLTNYWYPGRYTALGDGVRDGNRQVILAGLLNQFQEFWPEIRRYVLRRN